MIYRRFAPRSVSCAAAAVLAMVCAAAPFTQAYPQPSLSPKSWELKFDYQPPMRIVVEVPGSNVPKAYWYVTYTVTNNTDGDVQFLPSFDWVTNQGKVVKSDQNIPNAVFEKIKNKTGNKLLTDSIKIQGTLRVGEDQAKDGVAIWPEGDPRMGEFSIFVGGLSGESTQMTDSADKPMADKDGKPILLFKTLELDYKLAGDEVYAGNDLLTKLGEKYVMR